MIYRGRLDNLIFEFSIAKTPICNLIICEGLPSVPKQKEIITFLSDNGCNVFYPRYAGTWESEGEFLTHSPANDISLLANLLKKGEVAELYSNKIFNTKYPIHIIGSSFGGTVALSLISDHNISKIISLSPIVDFVIHNNKGTEQDLHWLKDFIKRAFGQGYRFKDENWDSMLKGNLFNPPQKIDGDKAKNILIGYDTTDHDIDHEKISQYASKNKISSIVTNNIGHLSFSKISQDLWMKIIKFISE